MSVHPTFEHWLQSRLTAHGFPVGPIDGIVGKKTKGAIEAFQQARGLSVNGKADAPTVEALRVSATLHLDRIPERDAPSAPSKELSVWPRQSEVPAFFGEVGKNHVLLDIPFPMALAWDLRTTVRRISVHKKVADSASRAFDAILRSYPYASQRRERGIDIFGGGFNVRRMRGGSAYSMHSWGIALDFDPERNQLNWGRDKARLARPDCDDFWAAWEGEGWLSLGRERNYDWMHVQAARL